MNPLEWFFKPLNDLINPKKADIDLLQTAIDEFKTKEKPHTVITNSNLNQSSGGFRPMNFDQYIGQDRTKEILRSLIKGNKKLGRVFPHTIISGKPGCGKTSLVKILARELGVSFVEIISSTIKEPSDIYKIIWGAKGGIVFLDECHALKRDLVEPLYPVMEDFKIGDEFIPPFTLIGATTELGEIIENRRPFYDRFKRPIILDDYTVENIETIVRQYHSKLFPNEKLSEEIFKTVAKNARLTPRIAIRLIESTVFMESNVVVALQSEGIIFEGFNSKDLKVLEILFDSPKGIGLQALASRLETSKKNFEFEIQPFLLKSEMIQVGSRGRMITEKGKELMNKMKNIK